jgi:hypothetical protein
MEKNAFPHETRERICSRTTAAESSVVVRGGLHVVGASTHNNNVATRICLEATNRRISIREALTDCGKLPDAGCPLITGKDKATVGELVYLRRVLLKAGPAPKMFFLTGSKGAQILTVTEGAHVIASPGNRVDVQGTIHSTPSVATLRKQWKVSLADAKRISETPIYIQCEFIRENGHDNAFREEHP